MSEDRTRALLSIVQQIGCAHVHITPATLGHWVGEHEPLHPTFACLSATHQADYLRAYLLHVHGGGYTDIKPTRQDWHPFFAQLEAVGALGLGYREIGPHGVAPVGGALQAELEARHAELLGFCAMIFRPRSVFTARWLAGVHDTLDRHAPALAQHPARHPQDRLGALFTDGSHSAYPLRWTELGGDLFHPLCLTYADQLLQADIAPQFTAYR